MVTTNSKMFPSLIKPFEQKKFVEDMQTLPLHYKFSYPSTAKQKADDFESVRLLLRLSNDRLPAKCEQGQYNELKTDRKLQKWKVPFSAKFSSQYTCATGNKVQIKYLFIIVQNMHIVTIIYTIL